MASLKGPVPADVWEAACHHRAGTAGAFEWATLYAFFIWALGRKVDPWTGLAWIGFLAEKYGIARAA